MFGAEFFSHHGSFGLILALRTIVAPRVVVVVGLDVDVRVLAGGAARCIAVVVVIAYIVVVVVVCVVGPSVRRVYESEVTLSSFVLSLLCSRQAECMVKQYVGFGSLSARVCTFHAFVRQSAFVRPSVRL